MKSYLLIDIGGSYTKINYLEGNVLKYKENIKTLNSKKFLEVLEDKIKFLLNKRSRFDYIGISSPGPLDVNKLTISPINLTKIRNLSFKKFKKYSNRFILEKDSTSAAVGAWVIGGKKNKNLVVLTLGTGLGCGLILNNKVYRGDGGASEFGNSFVNFNGEPIEKYVSSSGLLKLAKMNNLEVDCFELQALAEKGNKKAIKTYKEFSEYLAIAIANISNILDPEKVILTGGLANSSKFYIGDVSSLTKKYFFKGINPSIKVVKNNLSLVGLFYLLSC